ncbi:MAG: response regulator [Cyanobacteria bacterium RU_5_0]|nr:response regulator [Cyanobacteria bacterium RU_5_0]
MTKLLLVEDNDVNRDMLTRRLQRRGYDVVSASNGAEAISKTLSLQPNLVLMDLHLPVMDEWEAIRQLKANPKTQQIPVIALTADAMVSDRQHALAIGCDDYDIKPIDLPRLLDKMERLLVKSQSQPQDTASLIQDKRIQYALLTHLRYKLCTPIYTIIGFSDMLIDELKSRSNMALLGDLQKISACGTQLWKLATVILDTAQLEMNQPQWDIQRIGATVRLELLTPLSTVVGFCEILLEDASDDLTPDLTRIYTAAQQLLSLVNDIVNLIHWQLKALEATDFNMIEQSSESVDAIDLINNITISTHAPEHIGSILIIDDNETNCELLLRQLERQGHTVTIASDLPQAIQQMQMSPCHLILLNGVMSNQHGFEILSQLKQDHQWQQIPVIMIADMDAIDHAAKCIELGAEDYLLFPFKPILLRTKIAACLERKQLAKTHDHSTVENAPVGIYQSTSEGQLLRVNSAMVKMLGYSSAAEMMQHVTNIAQQIFVEPDDRDRLKQQLEEHGEITQFEYQAYCQDGDIIWVSESARIVRDANENLLYYEGIVQDVTARKLIEATLQRQIEELQGNVEQTKLAHQMTEIVQTDYFQHLKTDTENLQFQNGNGDRKKTTSKILLIEDNELNRDMLSRRLQRLGYEIIIAIDGAEGITKTMTEHPDLILMDMSLPEVDGWEATRQLKSNPQSHTIPIIALTAHAMAGDREQALAAGCDEYDTKPIEFPRLLSKVERLLEQRKMS